MKYYLYMRYPEGGELFYEMENEHELYDDIQERIIDLSPDEDYPVIEVMSSCQFDEYDSFVDYVEAKFLPVDGDVGGWLLAALIGEVKYGYPFGIVERIIGKYEVYPADKIPWQEMLIEYGQAAGYQEGPLYFSEKEINSKIAFEKGYIGLAEMLKSIEESK